MEKIPGTADGDLQESWDLRSGLSNWAWRTIEELKDDGGFFALAIDQT